MLRLILGRAKSGKTSAVMDEIRDRVAKREGNTVLLVPEQYSHEAEREMLCVCGDSMSLFAEVLSFTRLASRVENECGFAAGKTLTKGGKLLCMVRSLDAVGSRLRIYGAARRQIPLQQELLKTIDELKSCCISPDDLRLCAETAVGTLQEKLQDLSLIFEAYDAYAVQSGLDPMDRLSLLAERIGQSRFGKGHIYIDGFTDFTAQQNAVISALLHAGAMITVCLTCEGLEESYEIFEPSRKAAVKLKKMAEDAGRPCTVILHPDDPEIHGAMDFLERELFSFGKAQYDAAGAVTLQYAADVTSECEAAAAKCLELVRKTHCRWRDIAVAARDAETYRCALESIFPRYGIPLYTAKKTDILQKPLCALIAAAFTIVSGGWEYEDVISYLKTGLAGLSTAECDMLENYAFLWSLRGNAWKNDKDWQSHPDGFAEEYTDEARARLRRINALRRKAMHPLHVLAENGARAVTAAEQAEALAAYFEALQLPALLQKRAEELSALGMAQDASEYVQLWDIIVEALEQCAAVLGSVEMDLEQFGKLFCLVLSAYDVGTIPLSLDKVSAGDMDRMRRRRIRHLIVLGCDSVSLPRTENSACIFTDEDREALCAAGLDIGGTADERLYREFSLIYNSLTLPSDTLSLSWCLAGGEGGQATPAFVVSRAAALFQIEPQPVDIDVCRESAPDAAFELAAAAEGGRSFPAGAAAKRYFTEQGRESELKKLFDAAHLSRGRLSRSAVRALYGDTLRLSASRVDKLAGCSFSYFLQYGLKAKPRQPAEFAPPEMGTFMHFVLENVAREISENGGFAKVSGELVHSLCDKYVARYVREKLNDFREKSPRFVYLFQRLEKDVRAIVSDMVSELAKSDFVPLDFELNFGDAEAFPPISLGEGEDAMTLIGVADRVDGWVHDGKLYLRVVDYKTGKKSFSLSDVWYGIGLQMLLYLFALQRSGKARYHQEIVPAGVLYVPARDVLLSADADLSAEEILAEKARHKRRSGLLLQDDAVLNAMERGEEKQYLPISFKKEAWSGDALASAERLGLLSKHIDETLRSMARELRGGCIAADPWFRTQTENACKFCDYAEACHFNAPDDKIRYMSKLKPSQVWEFLEKGGEKA